jgi:uncharacterized protein (TIGR04141 family)
MSTSTHNLVCYLFKEEISSFNNLFKKTDGVSDEEKFNEIPLKEGIDIEVKGYLEKDKAHPPKWVSKLSPIFDFRDRISNISNSFVFFVKAESRVFAYTMGYAHHALNKSKIEYDFGLKVTLNEINYSNIRGLDVRKLSATSHQKREVSTSDSLMRDFEFDFNEEFINSLMGKSSNSSIANSLVGKESLKVNVTLDIEDIVEYSKKLLESYQKTDYKENFEFIDNLKVVKDESIWTILKEKVKESIQNEEKSKIVIAYPNISDFEFHNYKIFYSRKNKIYSDIGTDILFDFFTEKNITTNSINPELITISLMDDENNIVNKYSFWDYLVYEFNIENKKYIYSSNQIFEIKSDYYNTIISDIDQYELPLADQTINIPNIYCKDAFTPKNKPTIKVEDEGDYNERFVSLNDDKCICLDKNNFRDFPGRRNDQVEICDIVTANKELICVKTYKNSSSVLSHLFMQGIVSAELLISVKEYRKKLKNSVKYKFQNFIDLDNLNRKEITFVYAICIKKDGKIADNLPFFSKISLRQSIKNLRTLDFNVKLIRIPFEKVQSW